MLLVLTLCNLGCGGIRVEKVRLTERGIKNDRIFAIVDVETGKMVTQRQEPKMALISTAIHGNMLTLGFLSTVLDDDVTDPIFFEIPLYEDDLIKYLKEMEELTSTSSDNNSNHNRIQSNQNSPKISTQQPQQGSIESIERFKRSILIWADKVEAIDCGPYAAEFLDAVFPDHAGRYRLVRMLDQFDRKTFVGTIGGAEVNDTAEELLAKEKKPFGTVSMADSIM